MSDNTYEQVIRLRLEADNAKAMSSVKELNAEMAKTPPSVSGGGWFNRTGSYGVPGMARAVIGGGFNAGGGGSGMTPRGGAAGSSYLGGGIGAVVPRNTNYGGGGLGIGGTGGIPYGGGQGAGGSAGPGYLGGGLGVGLSGRPGSGQRYNPGRSPAGQAQQWAGVGLNLTRGHFGLAANQAIRAFNNSPLGSFGTGPVGRAIFGPLAGRSGLARTAQLGAGMAAAAVFGKAVSDFKAGVSHLVRAADQVASGIINADATRLGVNAGASMRRGRAYMVAGGSILGGMAVGGGIGASTGIGALPGAAIGGIIGGASAVPQLIGAKVQSMLEEKLASIMDGLVASLSKYNGAIYAKTKEYEFEQKRFLYSLGRHTQGMGTAWLDFKIHVLDVWERAMPQMQPFFDSLIGTFGDLATAAEGLPSMFLGLVESLGGLIAALPGTGRMDVKGTLANTAKTASMAAGDTRRAMAVKTMTDSELASHVGDAGDEFFIEARSEQRRRTRIQALKPLTPEQRLKAIKDAKAQYAAASEEQKDAWAKAPGNTMDPVTSMAGAEGLVDDKGNLKGDPKSKVGSANPFNWSKGNFLKMLSPDKIMAAWQRVKGSQLAYGSQNANSWQGRVYNGAEAWGRFQDPNGAYREIGSYDPRSAMTPDDAALKALSGRAGTVETRQQMQARQEKQAADQIAKGVAAGTAAGTTVNGQPVAALGKAPGPNWPQINQQVHLALEMKLQSEKGVQDAIHQVRETLLTALNQVTEDVRLQAAVLDGRNVAALF